MFVHVTAKSKILQVWKFIGTFTHYKYCDVSGACLFAHWENRTGVGNGFHDCLYDVWGRLHGNYTQILHLQFPSWLEKVLVSFTYVSGFQSTTFESFCLNQHFFRCSRHLFQQKSQPVQLQMYMLATKSIFGQSKASRDVGDQDENKRQWKTFATKTLKQL